MEWIPVISMFLATIGIICWFHMQSRADWKHSDQKIDENRREANENRKEITQILQAIQEEMKDFHGRLCAIEERRKG